MAISMATHASGGGKRVYLKVRVPILGLVPPGLLDIVLILGVREVVIAVGLRFLFLVVSVGTREYDKAYV
jgi:hypothetical protein